MKIENNTLILNESQIWALKELSESEEFYNHEGYASPELWQVISEDFKGKISLKDLAKLDDFINVETLEELKENLKNSLRDLYYFIKGN